MARLPVVTRLGAGGPRRTVACQRRQRVGIDRTVLIRPRKDMILAKRLACELAEVIGIRHAEAEARPPQRGYVADAGRTDETDSYGLSRSEVASIRTRQSRQRARRRDHGLRPAGKYDLRLQQS